MKAALFFLLLGGAVYWWMSGDTKDGTLRLGGLFERKEVDPLTAIEISDLKGRTMSCRVVGKRASFVQIERTADQRRFVIDLKTLDVPSRQRLEVVKDFNTKEVTPGIYELAKQSVKAELLYSPELCYFICPTSGQRILTDDSYYLDDYRRMLRSIGVSHREVVLKLERIGKGWVLPPDVNELPCVRVGEQVVTQRNSEAIKKAVVAAYLKQ